MSKGRRSKSPHRRRWLPFKQARKLARSLGLQSTAAWNEVAKSPQRLMGVPSSPGSYYAEFFPDEWRGLPDFLGYVSKRERKWRPFNQARRFMRSLRLRSQPEWQKFCQSGRKPADIPTEPRVIYKSEFRGLPDFLGYAGIEPPFRRRKETRRG
jgi:hypothetical protein